MPHPVPSDVRAKIDAVQRDFVKHFNANDMTGLAAIYTNNAKAMPAGMPIQTGHTAIAAFFGEVRKSIASVQLSTDELFASDATAKPDSCVERGKYEFFDGNGKAVDVGKYVVVLVEEGGQWKYYLDMFSSNGPMTGK